MNCLEAALTYAQQGWWVLPIHHPYGLGGCSCGRPDCKTPGKHPRLFHGIYESSTDPATIRDWWRRWPRANVGIATGQVSGFDVLDVDPRNGGDETLRELIAENAPLPETVEQITGSGGRHVLFAAAGLPLAASVGVGLDIRSDGGLIVAPPSLHASGQRYEWDALSDPSSVPLAAWPDWLLCLAARVTAPTSQSIPRVNGHTGHSIPAGTWSRVLAGCKRLRELAKAQATRGVTYHDWLAVASVARLGGTDAHQWAESFTSDYAPGCDPSDLAKMQAWLAGNLHGTATCRRLGCHPGVCGFRPHADAAGNTLEPSPLRHAWARTLTVEVA